MACELAGNSRSECKVFLQCFRLYPRIYLAVSSLLAAVRHHISAIKCEVVHIPFRTDVLFQGHRMCSHPRAIGLCHLCQLVERIIGIQGIFAVLPEVPLLSYVYRHIIPSTVSVSACSCCHTGRSHSLTLGFETCPALS